MIHLAVVMGLVCGAMFVATKAVDLLFILLNIVPKKEGFQSEKSAQMTERALDSLQLYEYSSPHYESTVNICESAVVCSETVSSLESSGEGLQAVAESAIEHILNAIESFSSSQ